MEDVTNIVQMLLAKVTNLESEMANLVAQKVEKEEGGDGVPVPHDLPPEEQGAFRLDTGAFEQNIVDGHFIFDGKRYKVQDQSANGDGLYYLHIDNKTPGNATVIADGETPTIDRKKTQIPLMRIVEGKVKEDYRGMPVVDPPRAPAKGSGLKITASDGTEKDEADEGDAVEKFDLAGREDGDSFAVHELRYGEGENDKIKIFSTDDVEVEGAGVTSANELKGDVKWIGGKKIRVETEGKKTIKITYDEDKEEEDPSPEDEDPCNDHPGGGDGVVVKDEETGGNAGGNGAGVWRPGMDAPGPGPFVPGVPSEDEGGGGTTGCDC